MNRLALILAGIGISSCIQMQVNNAQVFADRASRIAQSCPAAAEAAAGAQKSADGAQAAAGSLATHTAEAEKYRSQAEYWMQQAQQHAQRAEIERQEAERLRAARDARLSQLDQMVTACTAARNPVCWSGALGGATERGPGGIVCAGGDIEACGCSDQRSCDDRLAEAQARRAAGTSDLDRQIDAAAAAAKESETRARAAEAEARKASEAAGAANDLAGADAKNVATEERNAQNYLAAAAGACEDSLQADSNPPPAPVGGYPQDVFGSQSLGLPSGGPACAIGSPMFASCAVIQFQCNVSCAPGGASCSPGAPAGCLACYAAGCI